jgi:hypothetical protein
MSYEIFYDKQFIKAEKEGKTVFFPMVYGGSNNCIQYDRSNRGRRSRSWFNFTYPLEGRRYGMLEEMLENVEAERLKYIEGNKESNARYVAEGKPEWCDEYSDDRFGYYASLAIGGSTTRTTTFGMYKSIFVAGCKKALTVEELLEKGINVSINSSIYSKEDTEKFKAMGKEEFYFYPKTSEELMEKVEYFEEYIKDAPFVSMYVTIHASEYTMKNLRKRLYPKTKKEAVNVNTLPEYYVIKDTIAYNYVIKLTGNGYKYSYNGKSNCKRIANKKEAERFAKKACDKYGEEGRFIVETIINENVRVAV